MLIFLIFTWLKTKIIFDKEYSSFWILKKHFYLKVEKKV
jgi:hypothetical protein